MGLEIRRFRDIDSGAWDAYVRAHPLGSPMHLCAWKRTVEEVFHYQPHYLVAESQGEICGILPLFLVSSVLTGKRLISTPFAVYGGILASSEEAKQVLAAAASDLARRLKVRYLELRNAYEEQCAGFVRVRRYVTFTQQIGPDEEAILLGIPRKTRAAVRKALSFGLQSESTRDIQEFAEIYGRNLRRLGTPCFPEHFFASLLGNFGREADIRVVRYRGQAIAAVLSFYFRDQVLPYYGASVPAANAYQPNNFMYFDLMRWAGKAGFRVFDFGRSKKEGSGSYEFKSHWGMEERELPYEIVLVEQATLPDYTPLNPKFQALIRAWRLLPYPVARTLGPLIIRFFP